MLLLCPMTEVKKRDVLTGETWVEWVSAISRYNVVKKNWTVQDGDSETAKRLKLKAHTHLFGESGVTQFDSPEEFQSIETILNLKIPFDVWEKYEIHQQAKILAVHYLKNIISTIHRYEEMIIDNKKKKQQKLEAANKRK